MKVLLILTATVNPISKSVVRCDPNIRMKDYLTSLRLWWNCLKEFDSSILIGENSNFDISPIRELVAKLQANSRIKILQFLGDVNAVTRLGKGFGEAEIIDYLIDHAPEIHDCDFIVKCTGRLYVKNALPILKHCLAHNPDIVCSLRSNLSFADSRFFISKPEIFIKYFYNMGFEIDESKGIYFEHILLKRVLQAVLDGASWSSFSELPYYIGISATTGRGYNSSFGEVIKFIVKKKLHRLARHPGFYI